MLLAQISPTASFPVENQSPFQQPTVKVGDFIKVSVRHYVAGCDSCFIEVEFFAATINAASAEVPAVPAVPATDTEAEIPEVPAIPAKPAFVSKLESVGSASLQLTSQDISGWGTDDTDLLQIVATKMGTSFVAAYPVVIDNPPF